MRSLTANARHIGRFIVCLPLLAALAGAAWADPPGRVGRLAWMAGEVTLAGAGAAPAPAQLNWPVSTGSVIDTGASGRAEVTLGSLVLRLDVDSAVAVDQLDDQALRLRLEHGSLALRATTPEAARTSSVA